MARDKTGGRKKGTPNKDKQDLLDMIQDKFPDYHPLLAMVEIANNEEEVVMVTKKGIDIKVNAVTEDTKFQAHKEVCKYIVPQLKAIEHSGVDGAPITIQTYILPDGSKLDF